MNTVVSGFKKSLAGISIAATAVALGGLGSVEEASAASRAMIATTAVNLRSGPGTAHRVVGVVAARATVSANGTVTHGWHQVTAGHKSGWIFRTYLRPAAATGGPAAPPPSGAAKTTRYVAVQALNIRATAAPNGPIVAVVRYGTRLPLTGDVRGDRSQVVYKGTARWAYSRFLVASLPTALASPKPDLPPGLVTSGISRLSPSGKAVVRAVVAKFPKIRTIYGYRASTAVAGSDHPHGRAVDVMLPQWRSNVDYGWQVARYFQANAATYHVKYLIYRRSLWNAALPRRGWRPMEDRGGVTANHYDHVHVSVSR